MADCSQKVTAKILADGRAQSSHATNLSPTRRIFCTQWPLLVLCQVASRFIDPCQYWKWTAVSKGIRFIGLLSLVSNYSVDLILAVFNLAVG